MASTHQHPPLNTSKHNPEIKCILGKFNRMEEPIPRIQISKAFLNDSPNPSTQKKSSLVSNHCQSPTLSSSNVQKQLHNQIFSKSLESINGTISTMLQEHSSSLSPPHNQTPEIHFCLLPRLEIPLPGSLESQEAPNDSRVRGMYCPKTGTFYCAEELSASQINFLTKRRKRPSSDFWDVFEDILQHYQSPQQLTIEMKQIL